MGIVLLFLKTLAKELMKFLMCKPVFFQVQYVINPWMDLKQSIDLERVHREWQTLYNTIVGLGAKIELIKPIQNLPDMVFTANAGLYFKNKVFVSRFKHIERRGEEKYFLEWFTQKGFNVVYDEHSDAFEGAGDALKIGDKLFAAYGFRTDRSYYEKLPDFADGNLIFCELVDPYFYHLDTCFCPINPNLAIWNPKAFSKQSRIQIENNIEAIAVEEHESKQFACNAVVINDNVILAANNPIISQKLVERGLQVHPCEMSEFIKSGGACKCLTMRIDE